MNPVRKYFRNILRVAVGARYVGNLRSLEIHDLNNAHARCNTSQMASHNKLYLTKKEAMRRINKLGWKKCGWCMPEKANE